MIKNRDEKDGYYLMRCQISAMLCLPILTIYAEIIGTHKSVDIHFWRYRNHLKNLQYVVNAIFVRLIGDKVYMTLKNIN